MHRVSRLAGCLLSIFLGYAFLAVTPDKALAVTESPPSRDWDPSLKNSPTPDDVRTTATPASSSSKSLTYEFASAISALTPGSTFPHLTAVIPSANAWAAFLIAQPSAPSAPSASASPAAAPAAGGGSGDASDERRGFYVNLIKLVPLLVLYLIWVVSTNWAGVDAYNLNIPTGKMWSSIIFLTGAAGFILAFLIPVYVIGIILCVLAYFVPILLYVGVRNKLVPYEDMVLTTYHFGEVVNRILAMMRIRPIFNKGIEKRSDGPPVDFLARSAEVSDRVIEAQDSEFAFPAKELLYDAFTSRATEIHLEPIPAQQQLSVRLRVNGILENGEPFDGETGAGVLGLYQLIAGLDPNQKRKLQEGVFHTRIENHDIEYRIICSGTKAGEKMFIKILDPKTHLHKLEETGIRDKTADKLREMIHSQRGLIVVSAPPVSGKTTLLYAILREIDSFQRNVLLVEDYAEQKMDGLEQVVINPKDPDKKYTETLRTLLRKDPDVVAISDLTDPEVGTMMAQATISGRLVMVVVTANDAISGIARVLELGMDAETVATALLGIVSLRLVRVLDEETKEPYTPKPEFLRKANLPPEKVEVLYRVPPPELLPPGSDGYNGRTGVFELLVVNDKIRDIIREGANPAAVKAEARKNGMTYMQEEGLRLVVQGKTSIDELLRVVK